MSDEKNTTSIRLASGAHMPLVGLGTWKAEKGVVGKVVALALKNQYRLIDCASDYGNEEEVGQGLRDAFAAGIKREEVFITSKLWNTFHRKENVRKACERTLKDLGVSYLDLYLIHFPISIKYVPFEERYPPGWTAGPDVAMEIEDVTVRETWEAMEQLVRDGLVKHIGISNFNATLVQDLLKYAQIKPAVNQLEIHPYNPQTRLVAFCQSKGIAVTGYSSFGGISYTAFNPEASKYNALEEPAVLDVAKRINKGAAQVLLRWAVQKNIAVIPKTVDEQRLKDNLDLFSFSLSQEDMKALDAIFDRRPMRFNNPGVFVNYPIWD